MMLTQLAKVARRTGYPVVEVPGWKTRGRPGEMLGVETVTAHHTANGGAKGNYPSLRVVRDGRKGLPGPLAQYGLGVDGTIYVIAAGRCNHAGVSLKTAYTNPYAIGIEAEAVGVPGTASDWPPKQMDSYARLCRALYEEFKNVQIDDIRGHKETCSPRGRKSDPSFSMPNFRAKVAGTNLTPPKPKPPVVKPKPPVIAEDDMNKQEFREAFIDLAKTVPLIPNKVLKPGDVQGGDWTLVGNLAASDYKHDLTGQKVNGLVESVGKVAEVVAGVAARQVQIEGKLDALLTALAEHEEPDSPPPPPAP
jgi:hypothetical protein